MADWRDHLQSHRPRHPRPDCRLPHQRQQNPFRRRQIQSRQLLDAESQYILRRQRQNQPHGRHPMAGQAARPTGRQKRIRKEYIYLRPSRRRPRLLQSHVFKRIRTLQYFRAEQLRTEIGRTAYVLSRL